MILTTHRLFTATMGMVVDGSLISTLTNYFAITYHRLSRTQEHGVKLMMHQQSTDYPPQTIDKKRTLAPGYQ